MIQLREALFSPGILKPVLRDPISSVFTPGIKMSPECVSCDHLGMDFTSLVYMQIHKLVISANEGQTMLFLPILSIYECDVTVFVCAGVCRPERVRRREREDVRLVGGP